ncbi:DUF3618 domain-containing protein [Roseicella aerolata]|uniref:DUF3618 domain-containing protein n=1 Tax=Roseicella aerolata TaxID=2883479 RepID=A0A9X1IHQ9_9PROT|nr:DUF3618 domain-containing protein [Roseicella aerolata]MCB4825051.1 DUF3618 domain-containing protein [Roseicella aerolata]
MSMSDTDPGARSSAEIEREVEETRAGLTDTLDELRERASPGQLFEQAIDYARGSGGTEFMRNLGQQVRDNPLPLLLIGAGIGWLMMAGNRPAGASATMPSSGRMTGAGMTGTSRTVGSGGTRVRVYGEEGQSLTGRASSAMGSARDSVAGAADQAIDRAGQAYRGAADAASSAAESVRETAGSVADSMRGAASMAADRAAGTGQEIRAQAGEMGEQARQGVTWLMREQPLVLGAIGVALGAAVGALLPGTETEDRLMGQTRDAVADRVQATAQEGYERVKDRAGEHLERAQAAVGQATDQAGGAGGVGAALTEAAREVRHAARDAAQDIAGEARGAVQGGEDQPRREEGPAVTPTPPASPRIGPV